MISLILPAFTLFFGSFVAFDRVRIPREHLLNKTADVTPVGKYVSAFLDPNKRFGAALGALSGGRVAITSISVVNLRICLSIAIRYLPNSTDHESKALYV